MNNERTNRAVGLSRDVLTQRISPHRTAHSHTLRKAYRPVRVMKFGGTSVGDADCIRRVIEIIRAESVDSDLVVIVSAMSGVTNKLIQAANCAASGNLADATLMLENLRVQHQVVLDALIPAEHSRQLLSCRIKRLLTECNTWCENTARTGELSLPVQDLISGLGERLSAPLLAATLAAEGTPAEAIEATELVVTTSQHGAADPLMQLTRERSETRLRFILQNGVIPVVTGFIGAAPDGALTTLGRGGSDYSATILGAALDADEVIIWTDVDGMLTADPRLVPDAITIPDISYREAAELAYFGAKVLHPKTLDPVVRQGIPVWIRNTFAPERKGTRITSAAGETDRGVKALTAINDSAMITVGGATENLPDIGRRILSAVAVIQADVLMISQVVLANQVRLVVAKKFAQPLLETLLIEFESDMLSGKVERVSADSTVAILTIVGQDLEAINGIVGRAMEELARERVNVVATGQRSSDCSVSFVVSGKDISTALAVTHRLLRTRSLELAPSRQQLYRSAEALVSFGGPILNELKPRTRAGEQGGATRRSNGILAPTDLGTALDCVILDEVAFRSMIALERKRTERSRKPMLLMLLDAGNSLPFDKSGRVLSSVLSVLSLSTRDTDVTGWYKDQSIVGVMFTDISLDDHGEILGTMMHRVSRTMLNNLTLEKFSQISISMHVFPERWSSETSPGNPAFYPDLAQRESTHRAVLAVKRLIDVLGSSAALFLLSPLFFAVAVLVKLSSKGPMLFKQERLGQFGKPFTFLKFRSMHVNNDPKIHQEFMKRVINGQHDGQADGEEKKVYKMTDDPRITRIGRFLRRTSLDELPQFLNVFKGDMSLVGPRPPLAYECQEYEIWHRRRVLEVKPGITGLWQVRGRSRVRFDDMVRLDLQYVRSWSLWLDMKIMLQTPAAVLLGDDAF